jgi:hypothetical protein
VPRFTFLDRMLESLPLPLLVLLPNGSANGFTGGRSKSSPGDALYGIVGVG